MRSTPGSRPASRSVSRPWVVAATLLCAGSLFEAQVKEQGRPLGRDQFSPLRAALERFGKAIGS